MSEVLTIYDESSSQKYSDTFEEYSEHCVISISKESDKRNLIDIIHNEEKLGKKFIETYFYKFILRIQDSEVFSTRVAIYETIVYATTYEEARLKGMKNFLEKDKIFKFYGKELENLFNSLQNYSENKFDENCKIDFLRNKIVYVYSKKIEVDKISILEEGHKEY